MITRRTLLKASALVPLASTLRTGGRKVAQHVLISPHIDDETLTFALPLMNWVGRGENVHVAFMNRGGTATVRDYINGVSGCNCHPWRHSPAREGYEPLLTTADVGDARLLEARSAMSALSTIPAKDVYGVTIPQGNLTWSEGGLADNFGGTTLPPLESGSDAAEQAIRLLVQRFPNAFFYTMSEGDASPDHRACGIALRRLMNSDDVVPGRTSTYRQLLVNARFFVSRLYWAASNGGSYPQAVLDAAGVDENGASRLKWYNAATVGSRYDEYCGYIRTRLILPYTSWLPAQGVFGIGNHSVHAQFTNNFGTGVSIASVWHP